jgi:hypothetical protein
MTDVQAVALPAIEQGLVHHGDLGPDGKLSARNILRIHADAAGSPDPARGLVRAVYQAWLASHSSHTRRAVVGARGRAPGGCRPLSVSAARTWRRQCGSLRLETICRAVSVASRPCRSRWEGHLARLAFAAFG